MKNTREGFLLFDLLSGWREKETSFKADLRRLVLLLLLLILCVVSLFGWQACTMDNAQLCYSFFSSSSSPGLYPLDVTNLKELSEPRESSTGRQKPSDGVHARALPTHPNQPRHALYTHTHETFERFLCVPCCYASHLFCSFYRREKRMNVYYHPPSPHTQDLYTYLP